MYIKIYISLFLYIYIYIRIATEAAWTWWRSQALWLRWLSSDRLRFIAAEVGGFAAKLEAAAASRRAAAWKHWAAVTAMRDGARLARRFSKIPPS